MPTYTFTDTAGERFERIMKFSEIDSFLESNPGTVKAIDAPFVINNNLISVGSSAKPDHGFREVLAKAKAAHPLGSINTF